MGEIFNFLIFGKRKKEENYKEVSKSSISKLKNPERIKRDHQELHKMSSFQNFEFFLFGHTVIENKVE